MAKEAELRELLKTTKRPDPTAPLDLSAGAPCPKKPRLMKTNSVVQKRAESESPRLHEDTSSWTVDDVYSFVASIDICAEYAQVCKNFALDKHLVLV